MNVAIVHYWLVGMRGGESVLESLLDIYPQADIFTHVCDPGSISEKLWLRVKGTTWIGRLPFANQAYRNYLPLMPRALKSLDLSGYDLVITSESGPAKGVRVGDGATHLCYCHSPMRYVWDQRDVYLDRHRWFPRAALLPILERLREWDVTSAALPDAVIANSRFVADRVRNYWGRESTVVHPPVDVDRFAISRDVGNYYLWLGQLTRYKRPDLAVAAFNRSGRRLVVAGEGECRPELQRQASGNIEFVGRVDDGDATGLLSRCRALVFPGVEDFGIVPVEAMACGRPVIAYSGGGVLDTVVADQTGLFFDEHTADALNEAIDRFEAEVERFDPESTRAHARTFSRERFVGEFTAVAQRVISERNRT